MSFNPFGLRPHVLTCALLGASLLGATLPSQASAQSAAATPAVSAATAKAVSALAVGISGAAKGQIVSCPAALKLSPAAVCLYTKSSPALLRSTTRAQLAGRTVGDWKTTGQSSSLLVTEKAGGPLVAFILLRPLSTTETLVVVDAAQGQPTTAAPKPALPAGVVRGQPYVLGSDLVGVVGVTSLGGNRYRLSAEGQTSLTVTAGQKTAQTASGNVELPLAPASDGKNLIFPLSGLRALGCTVTPEGKVVTVACGADSVGLKPIIF